MHNYETQEMKSVWTRWYQRSRCLIDLSVKISAYILKLTSKLKNMGLFTFEMVYLKDFSDSQISLNWQR